jgi:hypothetical protein
MGHERTGALPKTAQWRQLVSDFGLATRSPEVLTGVAGRTLFNVRSRFARIHADSGVQAAFGFLVGLATSHLASQGEGLCDPPIRLSENPSTLRLVRELNDWVDQHGESQEYRELAKRAGAAAVMGWTKSQSRQANLFSEGLESASVWRAAGTGAGFSEVSRVFLASFVERYLKYFLEREASAELPTVEERNEFGRALEQRVDALSHHAFDSAQITQSFAAGWFNKRLTENRRPTNQELSGFLSFAFSKLRQELKREAPE